MTPPLTLAQAHARLLMPRLLQIAERIEFQAPESRHFEQCWRIHDGCLLRATNDALSALLALPSAPQPLDTSAGETPQDGCECLCHVGGVQTMCLHCADKPPNELQQMFEPASPPETPTIRPSAPQESPQDRCEWPNCTQPALCQSGNFGNRLVCAEHFEITNGPVASAPQEPQLTGVMMDKTKVGLYHKFNVTRTDGTSAPGGKHDGCDYFVLDLTHDVHALPALMAYVASCRGEFPLLAADLDKKIALLGAEYDVPDGI